MTYDIRLKISGYDTDVSLYSDLLKQNLPDYQPVLEDELDLVAGDGRYRATAYLIRHGEEDVVLRSIEVNLASIP